MKKTFSRALLLFAFFGSTAKFYSQLAPSPTLAVTNVPEASQYGVLYQLDIPVTANYASLPSILYSVNNSSLNLNYPRVAYFLQLDNKWVWVSMNKFNTTNAQLGLPYANSGIIYQQTVTAMNVFSSAGAGVTNTTGINGNIEIWPDCYNTGITVPGIGGNGGNYDFNDSRSPGTNCYGSFQVHNYGASQTIFALNNFMGGTLDLGIGNNAGPHPDWTFMDNAATYTTTRKLWILVQNGIIFNTQPSTTAQVACINGTVSALTVSTSIASGTLTNYQWYSVTTPTNTGGTLVATNTSSLTTNSYTPSTTTSGTLYYYCIANGTGSATSVSNVSGAYTVGNPTVTITGAGSICAGGSLVLTANSSPSSSTYTWSNATNTNTISVSPTVTTTYSVSGTTSLGCVGNSSAITVTVNPLPVISQANGTICSGGSFTFSPIGASSYTYSGGQATVSPTLTTNYTVSGTSAFGCVGTNTSVSVVVNALPVVSISGSNSICIGNSTSLTASGAASYTWSTLSNATGISVSPTLNTTYSVSGTSSAGCVSSLPAVTTITVNALPLITISGANTVCAGSSVSLTAGGASTYTWNTNATTALLTVTPAVTTTYSVSGTNSNGCVSSTNAVTSVSVISLPVVSISGTNAICAGNATTLTASGATSYTWSNASNASSISVSPASTSNYSVSGRNSAGCLNASPAVISVTVNPLPVVALTGVNSICIGNSTSLTATGAASYTWSTLSNATVISVSPTLNTTYSVSGTSSAGCVSSSSAVTTITVNALPLITISGANTVCAGSSVSLTAGGASTYTWNTNATTALITVTPAVNTTYSVSGTNSNGCVSSTSAVSSVSVISLPVLSISGTNSICAGNTATLTASGATSYTWSNASNASSISVSPATSTVYSVSGRNSSGCLSANASTFAISVNALPTLSISGGSSVCSGNTASLIASGASTYSWIGIGSIPVIGVAPTVNTSYTLTGTDAFGCAGIPVVRTITVNPVPSVSISGTNTICEGSSTNLTAAGANTYTWTGLGSTTLISVSPSVTTNYVVTGSNAFGCTSSATQTLTVNPLPVLVITGASGICTGQNVNLNVSGASSYSWSTGSTTTSIIATPTSNTTYTVIGTDALGCVNTKTQLVTVALSLSITITAPSAICLGDALSLTASGATTYSWNTSQTSQSITPTPSVTTTYSVIGSSGTCSNTALATVVVNPNPTVSISGPATICYGESLTLTANGADTYTWSNASNTSTILLSPTVTTSYSVTGQYTTGCASTMATTVVVNTLPILSINGASVLCAGSSTILTVNGANTYTWNTGAFTNTISINPATTTSYVVSGTDVNGCMNVSAAAEVTVNPVPNISVVSSASAVCAGDQLTMTASGADTYLWDDGAIAASVNYTPAVTTTYSVTGTNSFACTASTIIAVTVNALPTLSVDGSLIICVDESTTLTGLGAASYTWSTGDNSASVVIQPTITTTYSVSGTSNEGCFGNTSVQVIVNLCTGLTAATSIPKISLYPNPTSGNLHVNLEDASGAVILIHNVLGQLLVTTKAELINTLLLNGYDNGIYYLSVTKNNAVIYRNTIIKN